MSDTPERIWLQTGGDYAGAHEATIGTETGITWCDTQVEEGDDKYIRADIHEAEVSRLREALAFYAKDCDATPTTGCGYKGNLCCMTARATLDELARLGQEFDKDPV